MTLLRFKSCLDIYQKVISVWLLVVILINKQISRFLCVKSFLHVYFVVKHPTKTSRLYQFNECYFLNYKF